MEPSKGEKDARLLKPVRITEQDWPEGTVPVVSVFNWAYNHVEFIRESIESILMQETAFPVEIIIHDDASTDGTTEIIRQYEAKYPQLFRNIIQTENQWSQGKSVMDPMFTAPRGEFIALTHGDDYWTSPNKLQRQVDLLDAAPLSSLSYHPIETEVEGQRQRDTASHEFLVRGVAEVLQIRGIHTSSMVFRRRLVADLSGWMSGLPVGDIPLQLHLADAGRIVLLPETSSVYRKHAGGWTAGTRLETPRVVDALRRVLLGFDRYTKGKYRALVHSKLLELHVGAVGFADEVNDYKSAARHRLLALFTLVAFLDKTAVAKCLAGNVLGGRVRRVYFRLCELKNTLFGQAGSCKLMNKP